MRILKRVFFAFLCLVGCADMSVANKLQKIVYIETGPFGPTEQLTIDLKEKTVVYERSRDGFRIGEDGYEKKVADRKTTEKMLAKLAGFTGEHWKDSYSMPGICDGTFWRLYLTRMDGSVRELRGDNAWPDDFHETILIRELR